MINSDDLENKLSEPSKKFLKAIFNSKEILCQFSSAQSF